MPQQFPPQEVLYNAFRFTAVFIVLIVLVIAASLFLSNMLTAPIEQLVKGAKIIGQGNLDYVISVDSEDEMKNLADTLNKTTKDIKGYIQQIAVETKEKEQIASELRIATDIQNDMLPKVFPDFSERDDLELASFIKPAKEVGGDLFDFFFLDDTQRKIALVIADVSGKGVPAALFMVISKILIRNNKNVPIDEILEIVNNLLSEDNKASMFVTTYFSVLDLETGEYTYTSAGHNPPLLYQKESGELSYLSVQKAPPLAVFPNRKFPFETITLQKGDTLLLYTDGVTEAFNSKSEMYGTERLLENVKLSIDKPVDKIIDELYRTVEEFEDAEPQSDDITMLCFRYFGRDD